MTSASSRKIVVVGAGAIGSLIGGLLARAGEEVTLIARKAHVDAIHENSLRIDGVLGSFSVPVQAAEALDFQPDLVLLSVKAQDVEAACRQIEPYVQDALVVTLQNGVRSDSIVSSILPPKNIISGVVMFNAQFIDPGQVTCARGGPIIIGEAFAGNGQRVRDLQLLLGRVIRTELSANMQAVHWTKLLVNNLANGLEAMTGMTARECMRYLGLGKLNILALKEAYKTIKGAGHRLAPLPGFPMLLLQLMIRLPTQAGAWIMGRGIQSWKTLGSTLQSLRRDRPTEIDFLNGEIVRLGQQIGMQTPFNSRVVELVKEVGKTRLFYTPDELIRKFASK